MDRPLSPEAEHLVRRAEARLRERDARRAVMLEKARRAARILREEYGASRVVLFGSLLRGWFHEGSDLDLAVSGVAEDAMGRAWDHLIAELGTDIDLVSLDDAEAGLRQRILETGEPIEEPEAPPVGPVARVDR